MIHHSETSSTAGKSMNGIKFQNNPVQPKALVKWVNSLSSYHQANAKIRSSSGKSNYMFTAGQLEMSDATCGRGMRSSKLNKGQVTRENGRGRET
jgi:hypothetical protein